MHTPRNPVERTVLAVVALAVVTLAAACIPGGDDNGEAAFATTIPAAAAEATLEAINDADIAVSVGEWRCGEVKEALYRTIAALAEITGTAAQTTPADTAVTPEEAEEAQQAATAAFTSADQQALDAACETFGQHDAALELWAAGDRGDACDVWLPAHATAADTPIDLAVLHPLTARMWVSATGAVAEGHGRCIAERAN